MLKSSVGPPRVAGVAATGAVVAALVGTTAAFVDGIFTPNALRALPAIFASCFRPFGLNTSHPTMDIAAIVMIELPVTALAIAESNTEASAKPAR